MGSPAVTTTGFAQAPADLKSQRARRAPVVLQPPSVLGMNEASELKQTLIRHLGQEGRDVVVDMTCVTHLDTLPLAVLLTQAHAAARRRLTLAVADLHGQPARLVEEWAPEPPLQQYPDVEGALAAC